MKIVFNSSPLIFLARLNFLEIFVNSSTEFYRPEVVNDEIKAKQDMAINFRVKRSLFDAIFED